MCFFKLHFKHNGWMFSIKSLPPLLNGIMWSSVNFISGSDRWQHGQVLPYCFFNNSQSPKVCDNFSVFNLLTTRFLLPFSNFS